MGSSQCTEAGGQWGSGKVTALLIKSTGLTAASSVPFPSLSCPESRFMVTILSLLRFSKKAVSEVRGLFTAQWKDSL